MGRILWAAKSLARATARRPGFNPLTNGADIVGQCGTGRCNAAGASFNPLTNGADIVGAGHSLSTIGNLVKFQSPDQWGGYCGAAEYNHHCPEGHLSFNPLTNGADIVGWMGEADRRSLRLQFQSPDQWGGYCGVRRKLPLRWGADLVSIP